MTNTATRFLSECEVGSKAKILSLDLAPESRQRLMEMGLTAGAQIEVVRFAPLGDPMEIKVRGYFLSLRRSEAGSIQVKPQ